MEREFNTTGICVPKRHYMVDISNKLNQINQLIEKNKYFTINRGRQYGKTTTLAQLEKTFHHDYIFASISFEGLDDFHFSSSNEFCKIFMKLVKKSLEFSSAETLYIHDWFDSSVTDFVLLSEHISKLCAHKKVVLIIDEVDKTSNTKIFLNFLSMLREKYLKYINDEDHTFYSVILSGVYDIRNIKLPLINEGFYVQKESEKLYHSPWNIAVEFNIDMSFSTEEIMTMLYDYEREHLSNMNIQNIANHIYNYTNGYPYLVSKICKLVDDSMNKEWSADGINQSVKQLLTENNILFDDMIKNIERYQALHNLVYEVIFLGKKRIYEISNEAIRLGVMFGILSDKYENVTISNKIFEIKLCNYFIAKNEEQKYF